MADGSDEKRGVDVPDRIPTEGPSSGDDSPVGGADGPTGTDTRAPTRPPPDSSSLDPDLQETQIIGDEDLVREAARLTGPVATHATTAVQTPALATGSSWGRYEVAECLGEGGMGVVYRAFDRTLDRSVALKFIRQSSPDLVQRFFREARAQARVQHPNVCNVYEAGELDGEPYIAMQYIDGEDLATATADRGLEARLALLEDVARAVHAAHRLGLIHRDLKPGNILVEATDDGDLKPYVMDFGLVRDERDPGATVNGAMLGTPAYMAPEQAMGEVDRIDRRTDVYSLGAMAYRLLLGRPVFQVSNAVAHAVTVVQDEPERPRKLDPSIPRDVETIVLKCLEKRPEERYDSARALARDIRRYLDGDPIEARPIGPLRRGIKLARKHRGLTAVGAAAVLAIATLGAVTVEGRLRATRQAQLAQQFGDDASDIEWIMRVAHMADFHDIRPERDRVRGRMADIAERMGDRGDLAEAHGRYALGRGHLALGEHERAREQLEAAWAAGLQDPDVAYALGLTLTWHYQRELAAAAAIVDRDQRELRRREVKEEFHEPTVHYLTLGRGSQLAAPEYVEGLLALVEERFTDALERARAAAATNPAFYEARILEGHVHRAMGYERSKASDPAGAVAAYELAVEAYDRALSEGESDPAGYEGVCETWLNVVAAQFWLAVDPEEALGRASAACDRALTVEPDRGSAMVVQSMVDYYVGQARLRRGEDPERELARAAYLARRAIWLEPTDAKAYDRLGLAYLAALEAAVWNGRDGRLRHREAVGALEAAVAINPGYAHSLDHAGRAHRELGWWAWEQGQDALTPFADAIATFDRAIALRDESAFVTDRGNTYLDRAQLRRDMGQDGMGDVERAVVDFRAAMEMSAEDLYALPYAQVSLGTALAVKAAMELRRGDDPTDTLAAARAPLQLAATAMPGWHQPWMSLGMCEQTAAEYAAARGADPMPSLDQARRHLEQAADIESWDPLLFAVLAEVHVAVAEARAARGSRAEHALERARDALTRSADLGQDPGDLAETRARIDAIASR